VSAFGGIIGANREFDGDCARQIESMFLEVIVARADGLDFMGRRGLHDRVSGPLEGHAQPSAIDRRFPHPG